jgi:hypothetical protein
VEKLARQPGNGRTSLAPTATPTVDGVTRSIEIRECLVSRRAWITSWRRSSGPTARATSAGRAAGVNPRTTVTVIGDGAATDVGRSPVAVRLAFPRG